MKENIYIDTIEFYAEYDYYMDASFAAQTWRSDIGSNSVDGISSATIPVIADNAYEVQYHISWDCLNYNNIAVSEGTYTVKLSIIRHTRERPYGTNYACEIALGGNVAATSEFVLTDSSQDQTVFPYNVVSQGQVSYYGIDDQKKR
jgi:hypothetical protein